MNDLEFIALYTNRMVSDSDKKNLELNGKRIISLKGDVSLFTTQISLSDKVYVVGNRFDENVLKIINTAKVQNKPYRIFNDASELLK